MARGIQIDFLLAGLRNSSGEPLSGGKVYTYAAGTSTKQALYTDAAKTTVAANPVILDSYGKASVYGDTTYKFVIKDSSDVEIVTIDNLYYLVSENSINYAGLSAGAANTYNLTVTPPKTSYTDGDWFRFIAHQTNSGSAVANVSGLGNVTIKKGSGLSTLSASDIGNNGLIDLIYDATNTCFRLVSAAAGVWAVAQGGTGASDAATARTNLSAAKLGANTDITSITASTSDGSDTASVRFGGGGSVSANGRGARVDLYGADHATEAGRGYLVGDGGEVRIQTSASHDIQFWPNGTQRVNIDAGSGHIYPQVDGGIDVGISVGPKRIGNVRFTGQLLPATRQDYTVTNKTTLRTFDCNAAFNGTEWANVLDVIGNIIDDLISVGIFQ